MKVGILCGAARMAHRKAFTYYRAILEVGHSAVIFSRTPLEFPAPYTLAPTTTHMAQYADQSGAEFFITCTDALGEIVSMLNRKRGLPHIPPGSTHKANLGNLSPALQAIQTWDSLDTVPDALPIFIKPSNGSGKTGGDPWSYRAFDSKQDFLRFMTQHGGYGKFEHAQRHPGLMGKYVFQEYLANEGHIYHHFLNDGVAKPWLKAFIPDNYGVDPLLTSTYTLHTEDEYQFLPNVPKGVMCSFQAIPAAPPRIMDFNVRCGGQWTAVYPYVCPNFYNNFFNNLLNGKQEAYDWRCQSYTLVPQPKDGLIITIDDYPFNNEGSQQGLVLND